MPGSEKGILHDMDLIKQGLAIAQDPRQICWLGPLLLLFDAALSLLIVEKVPCKPPLSPKPQPRNHLTTKPTDTEIDWQAYMHHITQYISGERNYLKFTSPTGPLVYPGLHIYIYRGLYDLTSSGTDIRTAQYIFVALYLVALSLVISTYRRAGAPPWVLPMLVLSKRLHSVFMLRLFNDGFAVAFLFASVLCYQRKSWTVGGLMFSAGIAVKMSVLLALPAVGVILLLSIGRDRALKQAVIALQLQVTMPAISRVLVA
jgi:alpha-1,3-mannosyltransferase